MTDPLRRSAALGPRSKSERAKFDAALDALFAHVWGRSSQWALGRILVRIFANSIGHVPDWKDTAREMLRVAFPETYKKEPNETLRYARDARDLLLAVQRASDWLKEAPAIRKEVDKFLARTMPGDS